MAGVGSRVSGVEPAAIPTPYTRLPTPAPMRCAAHNNETLLRCGKCDAPICPDCTKIAPAGARCPACAAIGRTPLFQVSAGKVALGALAGFVSAFVVGYLLRLASGLGFFLLWGALIGGGAVGEA